MVGGIIGAFHASKTTELLDGIITLILHVYGNVDFWIYVAADLAIKLSEKDSNISDLL